MNNDFVIHIWIYIIGNIPLLLIHRKTVSMIVLHRVISIIDILVFSTILILSFYQIEPLYIIFVPIIIMISCTLSYGINEELGKEDIAALVTGGLPVSIKSVFIKVVTFPFYYLIKSWKNNLE